MSESVTVKGEAAIVDPERAGLSVNLSNKQLTTRAGHDRPPLPGRVADGAGRGDQSGDARADRIGAAHQHGRRGCHRSLRRRHLRGEPELRRGPGSGDQGARRRSGRRLEHGRPVHEHRHQERRQPVHGSAAFFAIAESFNTSNVERYSPPTTGRTSSRTRRSAVRSCATGSGSSGPTGASSAIRCSTTRRCRPRAAATSGSGRCTSQLTASQRLQVSFQTDRVVQENAVLRGSVGTGPFGRFDRRPA